MLVAVHDESADRVEASRDLDGGLFRCPQCRWPVVLKRGRVKVPHFAHQPGCEPCASAGESVAHMRAKALLADRFRAQGYSVVLEEAHSDHQRRVDVAVTLTDRSGQPQRIAVEVQDSAIAVGELKRRNAADRRAGFFATLWVFTSNRLQRTRSVLPGHELRLPEEMRYLINRWRTPITVLDVAHEQMFLVSTSMASREGTTWHDRNGEEQYSSDRVLIATREVNTTPSSFALTALPGRYAAAGRPDYTAGFRPLPQPSMPWCIETRPSSGAVPQTLSLDVPPTRLWERTDLVDLVREGGHVALLHPSSSRRWNLEVKTHPDSSLSYQWEFDDA